MIIVRLRTAQNTGEELQNYIAISVQLSYRVWSLTATKERCNVDAQVLENISNQIEDAAKNIVKALNDGVEGGIDVFKDRTDDGNLGEKTLDGRKEGVQVFNDSRQKLWNVIGKITPVIMGTINNTWGSLLGRYLRVEHIVEVPFGGIKLKIRLSCLKSIVDLVENKGNFVLGRIGGKATSRFLESRSTGGTTAH